MRKRAEEMEVAENCLIGWLGEVGLQQSLYSALPFVHTHTLSLYSPSSSSFLQPLFLIHCLISLENRYLKHVYIFAFVNQSCIFFLKRSKADQISSISFTLVSLPMPSSPPVGWLLAASPPHSFFIR